MMAIDKQAHFFGGMAISALLFPYIFLWALFAAGFAGAAKEVRDHYFDGTVDFGDLVATVLGGAAGCVGHFVMIYLVAVLA